MQLRCLLLVALLVAGAAAQEFPFKNGPLDPSLHSNKIFFDIDGLEDVAGVWIGRTHLVHAAIRNHQDELFAGSIRLEDFCRIANEEGIGYDGLINSPRSVIVFGPEEDHPFGKLVDIAPYFVTERNATGFSEGLLRLEDGVCRTWRPYFDWEVGKIMFIRNRRFYTWFEDGEFRINEGDFCVTEVLDHPYCTEGTFLVDGDEKTGVMLDSVYFYECTAGPCLELPHTLPGFVKTQGWQPRN